MKKNHKSKIVSVVCMLAMLFTLFTAGYAYADTMIASGSVVIPGTNAATKICDVSKHNDSKFGTIFVKRSLPNIKDFTIKVWMKDTTKSTVLSDKMIINCKKESKGHHIQIKSDVSFAVTDNVRFYAQKTGQNKAIDYTACAYRAFLNV